MRKTAAKRLITMRSSTHTITIHAPAERVFGLVSDPSQIPRWAVHFCTSVRVEGDALWATTPRGEVRFGMRVDRELFVVDFGHLGAEGTWRYSPTRVIPTDEGAVYFYTFFQRPGVSDERFAEMQREMDEELALLKELIEAAAGEQAPSHALAREARTNAIWRERLEAARERDARDPLAALRERFELPLGTDGLLPVAYFSGNALGLVSRNLRKGMEQALRQWAELGFRAHFDAKPSWLELDELVSARLARIVGAEPEDVAVMGTITANLHLLLPTFYRAKGERRVVLFEPHPFPTDRYAVRSQLLLRGGDPSTDMREIPIPAGQSHLRTEDVLAYLEAHGHEVALVLIGAVNHQSGQAYDLARITEIAHAKGCLVGADLAHAIGNIELRLREWNVDFAVWCHYKYLNAEPGGAGGIFVHPRHGQDPRLLRPAGWWGQKRETRLAMPPDFEPERGAWGFRLSGPPIVSLSALSGALESFEEAGMERLFAKREALVAAFFEHVDRLGPERVEVVTPRDARDRGGQLSVRLRGKSSSALVQGLAAHGVAVSGRAPDLCRIALAPLYNSFEDVCRLSHALEAMTA